ncbi:hypothetical protein AA313_de0205939 [Arthrobotrys entomopaga]|nr:hypothetical protein AA313_de0205939 [Arthrobotrys entomopaga]
MSNNPFPATGPSPGPRPSLGPANGTAHDAPASPPASNNPPQNGAEVGSHQLALGAKQHRSSLSQDADWGSDYSTTSDSGTPPYRPQSPASGGLQLNPSDASQYPQAYGELPPHEESLKSRVARVGGVVGKVVKQFGAGDTTYDPQLDISQSDDEESSDGILQRGDARDLP